MKQLRPLPLRPSYYRDVEREVLEALYELIFAPLMAEIKEYRKPPELTNAAGALEAALKTGRLQYVNGMFIGKLNAALTKELRALGAHFDKTRRAYTLAIGLLPIELKAAAAFARQRDEMMHKSLEAVLGKMDGEVDEKLKGFTFNPSVSKMAQDFDSTAKQLEVKPDLTEGAKEKLKAEYNDNMRRYIKDFSQQQIADLRKRVEDNAMSGMRYDSLVKMLRERYSVSNTKAQFLARQETALLMSGYHKARFKSAGITHYRWSARPNARPDHKALDGKIFAYDNPPITDKSTGARNNPGEDFNCLCIDVPLVGYQ